jgi:hypothetical protein
MGGGRLGTDIESLRMRQIEIGLLGALSVKNAGVSFNPNCFPMAVRDCIHCPKRKQPINVAMAIAYCDSVCSCLPVTKS